MSARESYRVCPADGRPRVRYRNRRAALAARQRVRHQLKALGVAVELLPTTFYRCHAREDGGCAGWHLARARKDVEEHLATQRLVPTRTGRRQLAAA